MHPGDAGRSARSAPLAVHGEQPGVCVGTARWWLRCDVRFRDSARFLPSQVKAGGGSLSGLLQRGLRRASSAFTTASPGARSGGAPREGCGEGRPREPTCPRGAHDWRCCVGLCHRAAPRPAFSVRPEDSCPRGEGRLLALQRPDHSPGRPGVDARGHSEPRRVLACLQRGHVAAAGAPVPAKPTGRAAGPVGVAGCRPGFEEAGSDPSRVGFAWLRPRRVRILSVSALARGDTGSRGFQPE